MDNAEMHRHATRTPKHKQLCVPTAGGFRSRIPRARRREDKSSVSSDLLRQCSMIITPFSRKIRTILGTSKRGCFIKRNGGFCQQARFAASRDGAHAVRSLMLCVAVCFWGNCGDETALCSRDLDRAAARRAHSKKIKPKHAPGASRSTWACSAP